MGRNYTAESMVRAVLVDSPSPDPSLRLPDSLEAAKARPVADESDGVKFPVGKIRTRWANRSR
jgi:hypothetical protein